MILAFLRQHLLIRLTRSFSIVITSVKCRKHIDERGSTIRRHKVNRTTNLSHRRAWHTRTRPEETKANKHLGIAYIAVETRKRAEHITAVLIRQDLLHHLLNILRTRYSWGILGISHRKDVEHRRDIVMINLVNDEPVHFKRLNILSFILQPHATVISYKPDMPTQIQPHLDDRIRDLPESVTSPVTRCGKQPVKLFPPRPIHLTRGITAEKEHLGDWGQPG